jgi:hypothetical protein
MGVVVMCVKVGIDTGYQLDKTFGVGIFVTAYLKQSN